MNVNNTDILTTDYNFLDGLGENSTTTLVESMTVSGSDWSDTLSYTYDCKGNIETISENGEQKAKYYYDELNQLIREDNAWLEKTIVYTYDNGGNILSVSEYTLTSASDISALVASSTDTYAYTDSNWKDKLTSFNGNAITYDEIGNPLTYYNGYEFDWQRGRQLAGITGDNLSISYKYNSSGIRTEKIVNGVKTTYTLEGSNIVKETKGTDTIWYYYDAAGSLTGFELNGTPYFYVKNVQGDIVAITDASGNIVVKYTYDSWGKLTSMTGLLVNTVGIKNPFRYRGYYYDTETNLYYLNSRYYDPVTKRFINVDGYLSTDISSAGCNTYRYCSNNPIMRVDSTGFSDRTANEAQELFVVLAFGAAVATVITVALLNPPTSLPVPSLDDLEEALKRKFAKTAEKSKSTTIADVAESDIADTLPKPPRKDHIHHIVAQTATRADPARKILNAVGIDHLTDPANLVQLPAYYHQRLHTKAYYDYVNEVITTAYETDGREGVYSALAVLKWEISTGAIW